MKLVMTKFCFKSESNISKKITAVIKTCKGGPLNCGRIGTGDFALRPVTKGLLLISPLFFLKLILS